MTPNTPDTPDTPGQKPRVSILIPNYNNGLESSVDGQTDLIANLLQSLKKTLRTDPTPFEIIAYDDGSTDDSLETLRQWAKKRWADGSPFLTLIEDQHCGVLARTANIMSRQAKGDILVRIDGDVVCLTHHWVSKLCQIFDQGDDSLGVIGPKQLKPNMTIHAYGDFILHPKGYTHIATGMPRHAVKNTLEVDHVMGCFYCCKKAVFDQLDGYDEDFLRGQTIDFGLRARLAGWQCFVVPSIEFIHAHVQRQNRATEADSDDGVFKTLNTFERKWGFSRLAPDLNWVRKNYAGTPLLWNPLYFGPTRYQNPVSQLPITIENSQWAKYAEDDKFRSKINLRIAVAADIFRQTDPIKKVAILGCGEGIVPHLLASQGVCCVGFDSRKQHIELAKSCTLNQKYPGPKPEFIAVDDLSQLPLEDQTVDLILIDRVLETHLNPVNVINESWRILAKDHFLAVVETRPTCEDYDPSDPKVFRRIMTRDRHFSWREFNIFIQAANGWVPAIKQESNDVSRDMVMIAKREEKPEPVAWQGLRNVDASKPKHT